MAHHIHIGHVFRMFVAVVRAWTVVGPIDARVS